MAVEIPRPLGILSAFPWPVRKIAISTIVVRNYNPSVQVDELPRAVEIPKGYSIMASGTRRYNLRTRPFFRFSSLAPEIQNRIFEYVKDEKKILSYDSTVGRWLTKQIIPINFLLIDKATYAHCAPAYHYNCKFSFVDPYEFKVFVNTAYNECWVRLLHLVYTVKPCPHWGADRKLAIQADFEELRTTLQEKGLLKKMHRIAIVLPLTNDLLDKTEYNTLRQAVPYDQGVRIWDHLDGVLGGCFSLFAREAAMESALGAFAKAKAVLVSLDARQDYKVYRMRLLLDWTVQRRCTWCSPLLVDTLQKQPEFSRPEGVDRQVYLPGANATFRGYLRIEGP